MKGELLPCPFCGSADTASVPAEDLPDYDADYDVVIQCMTCGACGPQPATSYLAARHKWNLRATKDT